MTETPPMSSDKPVRPLLVDARQLRCPLPLLRAKQALRDLSSGDRIEVMATDAGSVRDFHAFIEIGGHRMIAFTDTKGVYTYLIEKG
ncbi:MAG TPA: sulfurtransferase TusA family protein [Cellvibrionaceae bacterium]